MFSPVQFPDDQYALREIYEDDVEDIQSFLQTTGLPEGLRDFGSVVTVGHPTPAMYERAIPDWWLDSIGHNRDWAHRQPLYR